MHLRPASTCYIRQSSDGDNADRTGHKKERGEWIKHGSSIRACQRMALTESKAGAGVQNALEKVLSL